MDTIASTYQQGFHAALGRPRYTEHVANPHANRHLRHFWFVGYHAAIGVFNAIEHQRGWQDVFSVGRRAMIRAGWKAHRDGLPGWANPYGTGAGAFNHWCCGYLIRDRMVTAVGRNPKVEALKSAARVQAAIAAETASDLAAAA